MPNHLPGSLRPLNTVVFERRCAIYTEAAHRISLLEDCLTPSTPKERLLLLLGDLRRTLRGNLAFLDRPVVRELERLEVLREQLASGKPELLEETRDRLAILHLQLSRLLQRQIGLVPLNQIVELDPRLEQRIEDEARLERVQAKAQALVEECQHLETEARTQIANEEFGKAAKALRQAIKIDPRRAVLRNDLGVVLSLLGKAAEAAAEYRAAIALNEQEPSRRTEEWTTSYYNLGVALRKLAQQAFRAGHVDEGRENLRCAGESFHAFRELQRGVGGEAHPRVAEAEQALAEIERRLGTVIGAPTA